MTEMSAPRITVIASVAKQSIHRPVRKDGIASSLSLLAMTGRATFPELE
jgi:hypothetical protein